MSFLNLQNCMRQRVRTLALTSRFSACRLNKMTARVLNKDKPIPTETYVNYTASSDDESPTGRTDAAQTLFDDKHITAWSPGLLLYAPIGLLVGTLRSAIWILCIALDQAWFRNQAVVEAYLRLLGVTVTWRHAERIPTGRHIMVSNHCSVGDLMMLFSHPTLPQRYTHLITSALPSQVTCARHLPVVMRTASPATYDELASSSEPSPVHLFPEGGMTNGHGMLRFSRGFTRILQQKQKQQKHAQANIEQLVEQQQITSQQRLWKEGDGGTAKHSAEAVLPVTPVALRVHSSLPEVNSHTLDSSFLSNLFWFGFSPSTTLEATVLPPMVPLPGEARGAFVNRVQAAIAAELGVPMYDMTIQQKRQLTGGGKRS